MATVLKSVFLAACIAQISFGVADYTLLQSIVGKYPILSLQGDRLTAGMAEVFATDAGVGYRLSALPGSSRPVPQLEVITPKDTTVITKNGNVVLQVGKSAAGEDVRIEYTIADGYFQMNGQTCRTSNACRVEVMELGNGKSSGQQVEVKKFCSDFLGSYTVEEVSGEKPHPETSLATIDFDNETGECVFQFPYCQPDGVCDPGYMFFDPSTLIYHTNLNTTQEQYTVLASFSGKPARFTWEKNAGYYRFVNFEYQLLNGTKTVLEFKAKK